MSRYFAPWWGIDEDPVTGVAHCSLAGSGACVATCINLLLGDDAAVDSLGPPPTKRAFHINTDVLIAELRRIHNLKGYRMRNAPKPDIERLRREVKGPDA